MPYRGRAIKRIKGQMRLKASAPTCKFTMTKNFELASDSAQSSTYILGMDVSTPFNPLFSVEDGSGNVLGDWQDNDSGYTEPVGLASDLYTHYNMLVVKGCHVSASVSQATDVAKEENETLGTGQITLLRTAELISGIPTSQDIKQYFGQKTKNFQLSTGQGALTKNAYVSNGYSAKRQFNVNANANEDLKVVNASGSSNKAENKTYMYLIVKPRKDLPADGSAYLIPMNITLKLSYIVQFQDPTKSQSVPLPMSTRGRARRGGKKNYRGHSGSHFSVPTYGQLGAMLGMMTPALAIAQGRRGRAIAGGRQLGPWIGNNWVQ